MLMTGLFVIGAGAGAVLTYARDRKLLGLYWNLVHDLSDMIPPPEPETPDPPAAAARITELPPMVEAQRKAAS